MAQELNLIPRDPQYFNPFTEKAKRKVSNTVFLVNYSEEMFKYFPERKKIFLVLSGCHKLSLSFLTLIEEHL